MVIIADILRLLAVKRLKATGATPNTNSVAFAVASRGDMSGYSYVSAQLVDARMATHPARQPSGISGLSPPQHNERPPVGGFSSQATVVTPTAGSDADVGNSPTWTHVDDWQLRQNFDLPDWVGVDSAGNYSVLQQTSGSASSSVFNQSVLAQQAAMPSATNMQPWRYVLATPGGRRILTNDEYVEAAKRVLRARAIMGGVYCSVNRYIELFGIPGDDPRTRFGTHITHGLLHLFDRYNFRHQFEHGHQCLGWFLCPIPFSRQNAFLPRFDNDSQFYPAVFVLWHGRDDVLMACEAILLAQSRPWLVDISRVWVVMSLAAARAEARTQMHG